ncbi:MAG: hypothetical protein GF364_04745 [Candidatus Lokiarchaeota archaeon]|nr:hypothetical protein [Candidatus Lokiarchaeota archaeon]
MSYIPKYILKRMLPKDCIKAVDDGVEITFLNVISPIAIEEIPDNPLDYIEFIVDGKAIPDDVVKNVKISMDDEVATIDNLKQYIGRTIPVGGKLIINLPLADVSAGEEHEFDITLKTDNPFNIKVKRKIQ